MASTRKRIDEWTEAGLPREQATRMVLALDEHASATAVDQATFRGEMDRLPVELRTEIKQLRTEVRAEIEQLRTQVRAEIEQLRAEVRAEIDKLRSEFDAKLAALENRLMVRVVGLVVVQLGLFWAITKLL